MPETRRPKLRRIRIRRGAERIDDSFDATSAEARAAELLAGTPPPSASDTPTIEPITPPVKALFAVTLGAGARATETGTPAKHEKKGSARARRPKKG
ncbi:hypothetical protein L6R52_43630 [Myxococcota bacterium]|nr:hypothetical protein [Myxococcota bacterium]